MPEHVDITDPAIHEPKGVATAGANQVYVANGAGSGVWTQPDFMGFWDYNDLATSTTPITLSAAATYFNLTNDEAGPNTNKTYKLSSVADVWDEINNEFDFSGLVLGDTVDIRFDIEVTTAGANHEVDMRLAMAQGSISPYNLNVHRQNFKVAGTYPITRWYGIYIGDSNTLDYPAKIQIATDAGATDTVQVNGWYIRVMKRTLA